LIEVIEAGPLTSVQDLGRFGYRQIGVGQSGAMDDFAFRIANILVNNPQNTPGLEITLGGFSFRSTVNTTVSYTGADVSLTVDGREIPSWSCFELLANQIVTTSMSLDGLRSYLSFSGGLKVEEYMGSASTDLKAGFGGLEGRALRKGDQLSLVSIEPSFALTRRFGLSRRVISDRKRDTTIPVRVIVTELFRSLTPHQKGQLLDTQWRISPQSNRLGYRLEGRPMQINVPELKSHGILPGGVQLPPSGQPIIQLNDANTCGGYPNLATVVAADMHLLAQARPGNTLQLIPCSPEEAVQLLQQRCDDLEVLAYQARAMRSQLR
jgi:biotin-dependent carboxylase-like uncharacterized protein